MVAKPPETKTRTKTNVQHKKASRPKPKYAGERPTKRQWRANKRSREPAELAIQGWMFAPIWAKWRLSKYPSNLWTKKFAKEGQSEQLKTAFASHLPPHPQIVRSRSAFTRILHIPNLDTFRLIPRKFVQNTPFSANDKNLQNLTCFERIFRFFCNFLRRISASIRWRTDFHTG